MPSNSIGIILGPCQNLSRHEQSPEELCDLASQFIRSPDLWAYAKMLVLVNSIVLQLEWLANSCPGHRRLAKVVRSSGIWFKTLRRHMNSFHCSSLGSNCPVKGCVGPEIGAGEFMQAFERFRAIASAEVLLLVADVHIESRETILLDLEFAHQHLQYVLMLKLGPLSSSLPYIIMALGHLQLGDCCACVQRGA